MSLDFRGVMDAYYTVAYLGQVPSHLFILPVCPSYLRCSDVPKEARIAVAILCGSCALDGHDGLSKSAIMG